MESILILQIQVSEVKEVPPSREATARQTEISNLNLRSIASPHFSPKFTRMKGQPLALMIGFLLTGSAFAISEPKESPVIVHLHAHRGEIRAALLKRTPLGSSVKSVLDFISKQLQQNGRMPPVTVEPVKNGSEPRATKSLRAYLGQYYDHPEVVFLSAPLLMQKEVTAQWLFDSRDRLINIVVEKKNGVY